MNVLKLLTAARSDDPLRLQQMLDDGPDPNSPDCDGWTALHMAAALGSTTLVRALIARGARVASKNRQGDTPLHFAVLLDHPEAARALVELGGTALLELRNATGRTPLDYARIASQSGVAAMLRRLSPQHVPAPPDKARLTSPSRGIEPPAPAGARAYDETETDGGGTDDDNADGCAHRGAALSPTTTVPPSGERGHAAGLPGPRTRGLPSPPALAAVPPLPTR